MKYILFVLILCIYGCGNTQTHKTANDYDSRITSALNGDTQVQEKLGSAYALGEIGTEIDTIKAEFWYCTAFKNGNQNAGYLLGRMMSGTHYFLGRRSFFEAEGYQHKICNLEQLLMIDPSLKEYPTLFWENS